jgi:hypothetical protein
MVYGDTEGQPSKPDLTNITVSGKWCSKMVVIHEVTTSNAVRKWRRGTWRINYVRASFLYFWQNNYCFFSFLMRGFHDLSRQKTSSLFIRFKLRCISTVFLRRQFPYLDIPARRSVSRRKVWWYNIWCYSRLFGVVKTYVASMLLNMVLHSLYRSSSIVTSAAEKGSPKSIEVSHLNSLHFSTWQQQWFGQCSDIWPFAIIIYYN